MTPDTDRKGQGASGEVRRLAVARVRFGVVRNPPAQADKWALLRDADGLLVIELQTASVPADRRSTFDAAVRTSRDAHPALDETGSLAKATADYFTQWVDDQTRTVWASPDVLGWADVSTVLGRCQQSLLDAVKGQAEGLATGAGVPELPDELGAGIGADLILAPEMRLEKDLSSFIDICVMGIGFATGQPHLVVAAAKHLMHTEFDNALEHGAAEILKGLLNPAPAAPGPTGQGWIKPTEPGAAGGERPAPPLDTSLQPVQQDPVQQDPVQQDPVQQEPEQAEFKIPPVASDPEPEEPERFGFSP